MSNTVVELVGVNGETFNLTTGDKGVYLATDPKGAFFDPPVKAVYEEPGNYPGSRYLNHRVLRRDITFGVEILNDAATGQNSWLSRDARWRKAWAFDKDCVLKVTTDESGTRRLKLRLLESPEVDMYVDPNLRSINRTVMVCVAQDPFWYGDDAIFTATTGNGSAELTLSVPVCNPTDQYIFPIWSVPGSTQNPVDPYIPGIPWLGARAAPKVTWTLPDYSWEDPSQYSRRVTLPGLIGGVRTNEIQVFNVDGIIQGGTFSLTFNGETTGPLQWNASTNQVEAALTSLATVAYQEVEVTRGQSTREIQVLQLENATGGSFTLTFGNQTTAPIPFNATDTEIKSALVALQSVQLFDLTVQSKVSNDVQLVTLIGEPTDGEFTLTFDGYTTEGIDWNANSVEVKSKLVQLPNIDINDIDVDRQWWKKYSPWEIRFKDKFRGVKVPLMSGNPDSLEGGAGMDVIVTKQSPGGRPYYIKFGGDRKGQNVPELIVNTSGLTRADPAGPAPVGFVYTEVPGGYPYICEFKGNISGVNFPPIVVNTAGLSHYGGAGYRSWKNQVGYTAPAENCLINTDPRMEQIVSESASNIWARMNGVRFRNPIPPYTGAKNFYVSVTGCTAGQMVMLRLPRPWSRPWGLE